MTRRLALLVALLAAAHLLYPLASLLDAQAVSDGLAGDILVQLRLPRTALVIVYGLSLGIAGAAIQAVFANPLASPDISGASSGAALAAVVATYILGISAPLALAAAGMAGAGLALGLLFALAGRKAGVASLLLAGIALSLALGAATTLALALAPSPYAFYDAFAWLMGDFADRSLDQALVAAVPALAASLYLWRKAATLDLLALGHEMAAGLGVDPARLARRVVLASAVALGACVSVAGAIGFVGLVGPVIARRLVRGHPGRALMPAGLIGAALLLAADLAVRLAPLNTPLPVGVVTSLVGTPVLIAMLLRQRWSLAS